MNQSCFKLDPTFKRHDDETVPDHPLSEVIRVPRVVPEAHVANGVPGVALVFLEIQLLPVGHCLENNRQNPKSEAKVFYGVGLFGDALADEEPRDAEHCEVCDALHVDFFLHVPFVPAIWAVLLLVDNLLILIPREIFVCLPFA